MFIDTSRDPSRTATDSWASEPSPSVDHYPKLDDQQAGHVRHILNLVDQLDHDWDGMGGPVPGQELTDSYRYQLTEMTYALGFAHFHHMPAAAGVFRGAIERMIHKMQLSDVWSYWNETSRGGTLLDPDLTELRDGWRDPIVKENIMYSGRFFAMLGMHSMLFDSDQYDELGAISLRYAPKLHGMGPEVFEYSISSLSEVIYWQMVESGFLGIVCEPNALFVVCNQFPILGWRFLDLRKGTTTADEVTRAFTDAWDKRGMLDPNGDYWRFWLEKQEVPVQLLGGASSQWTALNMNAWNRELVHSLYPDQIADNIRRTSDGLLTLAEPTVMVETRTARKEGREPAFARDLTYEWDQSEFGYTVACMAEMGDEQNLQDMLTYAEKHLNPTWRDGGLFYPRSDTSFDDQGRYIYMDRLTGNAMIGYARLNVPDGLWKMYHEPWSGAHFAQPYLREISGRADVLRAWFDADDGVLALTLRPVHGGDAAEVELTLGNIDAASEWVLHHDKIAVARLGTGGVVEIRGGSPVNMSVSGGGVTLTLSVSRETELVLTRH